MKIVEVEWEDACANSGYLDKEHWDTSHRPVLCKTVGHLYKKNSGMVLLASEKFEDGDLRYTHTIPRKMIKKITVLKG